MSPSLCRYCADHVGSCQFASYPVAKAFFCPNANEQDRDGAKNAIVARELAAMESTASGKGQD